MNSSGGRVVRIGAGSSVATASFAKAKAAVVVSVTNRGDGPVLVDARDAGGGSVARFKLPPGGGKVDRTMKGVRVVDFTCDQGVRCTFDYALSVL